VNGFEGFAMVDPEEYARQQAEMAAAQQRAEMRWADFSNSFTAMVTEELSAEHLTIVAGVLALISGNGNPTALANFYEGICAGALATRKRRCGEGEDDTDKEAASLFNSHDPRRA
jgi:hypothetical protein